MYGVVPLAQKSIFNIDMLLYSQIKADKIRPYYMPSSVSGQDELKLVL